MSNIQDDSFYDEETYSKGLNREDTLEAQIRLIASYYSKGLLDEFEWSLKALLPLLPKGVRDRFKPLQHDVGSEGVERHFQMFLEIQVFLESDTNMIWKKKFIKTYE